MPRNPRKSDVPTLTELATALEISSRRVSQLKEKGMPVHSIEAAKVWRAEKLRTKPGDSAEELRQRRIALLREQTRCAKITADERANLLIPIADVAERDTRIGFAVRSAVMMLENHLPPKLAGLTEPQVAAVLHDELHQILEQLADDQSEFWTGYKSSESGKF